MLSKSYGQLFLMGGGSGDLYLGQSPRKIRNQLNRKKNQISDFYFGVMVVSVLKMTPIFSHNSKNKNRITFFPFYLAHSESLIKFPPLLRRGEGQGGLHILNYDTANLLNIDVFRLSEWQSLYYLVHIPWPNSICPVEKLAPLVIMDPQLRGISNPLFITSVWYREV